MGRDVYVGGLGGGGKWRSVTIRQQRISGLILCEIEILY